MNVVLPEKERVSKKRIIIYLTIIFLCIIFVGIAMYQFFADEKLDVILGLTKADDEEIENLKAEFDGLFQNKIIKEQKVAGITKEAEDKDLVYSSYEKKENSVNNYDLDVNIPYINIDNNLADTYNFEIKKIFEKYAEEILNSENRNIVYTVNYFASIENNILSLAILSTFKDGENVQRTILKTYNYNIKENKEVTLNDFLKIKNVNQNEANKIIKNEITKAQEQAESLKDLGYNIYSRDINDSMYKVENATEFFMLDGKIYIVYSYGNNKKTSEMDLVIIR